MIPPGNPHISYLSRGKEASACSEKKNQLKNWNPGNNQASQPSGKKRKLLTAQQDRSMNVLCKNKK